MSLYVLIVSQEDVSSTQEAKTSGVHTAQASSIFEGSSGVSRSSHQLAVRYERYPSRTDTRRARNPNTPYEELFSKSETESLSFYLYEVGNIGQSREQNTPSSPAFYKDIYDNFMNCLHTVQCQVYIHSTYLPVSPSPPRNEKHISFEMHVH